MKLYSQNENYKLYEGNMLDMLDFIPEGSVDSIITDPPYELNFMGKGWDNSGIAFQKETWEQCFKALKSGGYLLAFGGSRTFHRIACAIEDAGFEIRDTIMWLYGSGFPKSMNIGKMYDKKMGNDREIIGETKIGKTSLGDGSGWDTSQNMKDIKASGKIDITKGSSKFEGWGSSLKPSFEPIIVARKPFKGSLVDNVIEYGVGGINIDECRVGNEVIKGGTMPDFRDIGQKSKEAIGIDKLSFGQVENAKRKPLDDHTGRFPANTILTYDDTDFDEVCGGFPNTKGFYRPNCKDKSYNQSSNIQLGGGNVSSQYNDSGSASRYFYCAKASKKDRDEGLDNFEEKMTCVDEHYANEYKEDVNACSGKYNATQCPKKNTHPTVKPTDLMQYLVRLVTPNDGTILDPFNGSGSTGKAVMYENKERNKNYKYIGIELTEEYLPISKARIEYVCNLKEKELKDMQMSIFDFKGSDKE